ncbi:hypothetical protein [Tuwongella immobilis]|uniref:Uncharacterized protein n=1 Tax=Tuwongella immobilis TaxID=692036 RepID=A0A6C2YH71_9BACT|nr:hypothetical protein [Tuwongella immobilis]VIP00757.1 unnamed protein product [Tuwongella immobilis]VTR96932.1 unnamed protein product [Tuwongella immobilis]
MTSFRIRYEPNKGVNFVHLINFLVSYEIMTLEQCVSVYKRFKLAEDISLEIPDGLVAEFRRELTSLGCVSE